jgi:hypothetical protein
MMQTFYRATNGVTVLCPAAAVGDTGVIDGVTYTKRDRLGIDLLVSTATTNAELYEGLATSCISGVTDLQQPFTDSNFDPIVPDGATFNPDLSSWDVSSVLNMESLFDGLPAFNSPLGEWDTSSVENMAYVFYVRVASCPCVFTMTYLICVAPVDRCSRRRATLLFSGLSLQSGYQ